MISSVRIIGAVFDMPKKVDAKRPKPQEAENVNLYGQIPYYVLSRMPNITSFYALIEGKC